MMGGSTYDKSIKTIVAVCAVFFCAATASSLNAAVDLPWSTTYNCPEWNQTQGGLSCNGLQKALDGTCQGQGEQITQSANYPGGGEAKVNATGKEMERTATAVVHSSISTLPRKSFGYAGT